MVSHLASSFVTLMTLPVKSQKTKSQDVGSNADARASSPPPESSEFSEDAEDDEELQGLEEENEVLRAPQKSSAMASKSKEQEAAQAASLRFRKKLDVVIMSKVTSAMCTAGVYNSPQLWTSFSRSLQVHDQFPCALI